jgi:hypothetical protein
MVLTVGQGEAGAYSIEGVLCEGQTWSLCDDPPRAVSRICGSKHGGGAVHAYDESRRPGGFRGGGCERAGATPDVKHPVADFDWQHRDEVARRSHEMRGHGHAAVHLRDGGIAIR